MNVVNIDPTTGIRFGVVLAANVPELFYDIVLYGESLTLQEYLNDVRARLASAKRAGDIKDLLAYVDESMTQQLKFPLSPEQTEALCDEIVADFEPREEEFEYVFETDLGRVRCLTFYLGGAPHVMIVESPYVAWCRPCSPCVPGAGDLDSLCETGAGVLAYCPPPEFLGEDIIVEKDEARKLNVCVKPLEA